MSHLVMFDLDGTLTLTNDVDSRCYVQAMSEHLGFTIGDDWSQYRHVTDSGIAAELFERHQRSIGELARVRERFISLLVHSLASEPDCCRQVSGADQFLRRLCTMPGVVIGLATGGWAEAARAKLRHAGIAVDDMVLASADDAEARTTIMEICQERASSAAGVRDFSTVTYFGDAIWDVNAAAALGCRFIGIASGSEAERLRTAGARSVFEDFTSGAAVLSALGIK